MIDFERGFPDIAEKYFDLRFDEENQYGNNYGYGRKYANKQSCQICEEQQKSWEDAYLGIMSLEKATVRYFQKEIDLQCLLYADIACVRYSKEMLADWFCDKLLGMSICEVFEMFRNNPSLEDVLPSNIPQFSNLSDAYIETPNTLWLSGQSMTYDELGTYLDNGKEKNEVAQRKYGENHSKLAALLDLVVITTPNNSYKVALSVFGIAFNKRNDTEKKKLTARLILRIPIIQKMLIDALASEIDIEDELFCLAVQTKKRRRPNIATLLQFIADEVGNEGGVLQKVLDNIKGWR
jgi:hypothetical protein